MYVVCGIRVDFESISFEKKKEKRKPIATGLTRNASFVADESVRDWSSLIGRQVVAACFLTSIFLIACYYYYYYFKSFIMIFFGASGFSIFRSAWESFSSIFFDNLEILFLFYFDMMEGAGEDLTNIFIFPQCDRLGSLFLERGAIEDQERFFLRIKETK